MSSLGEIQISVSTKFLTIVFLLNYIYSFYSFCHQSGHNNGNHPILFFTTADFIYCVLDNPNNCFFHLFQKMLQEESDEYEVEAVIDERVRKEKIEFHVKHQGYQQEENAWEREENVSSCRERIDEYRA